MTHAADIRTSFFVTTNQHFCEIINRECRELYLQINSKRVRLPKFLSPTKLFTSLIKSSIIHDPCSFSRRDRPPFVITKVFIAHSHQRSRNCMKEKSWREKLKFGANTDGSASRVVAVFSSVKSFIKLTNG